MKKIITLFFLGMGISLFGEEIVVPMLPILPAQKVEEGAIKPLETKTIIMKMETKIEVPLEIISDAEIQALIIDEQRAIVPFDIELNKEPDKKDYYKVNYSETEIDIDNDGKIDTKIYSNQFINSKVEKKNYVVIEGKNISKEGYHEKTIYLTVETND